MPADRHDWLAAARRRAHRTADAAPVVVEAVRRAEMDPEAPAPDDPAKSGSTASSKGQKSHTREVSRKTRLRP